MADMVSSFQDLDKVLIFLAKQENSLQFEQIQDGLINDGIEITGRDLFRVLGKLSTEGFVEHTILNTGYPGMFDTDTAKMHLYFITFDGKFLIENGGYQKKLKEESDREWLINKQITSSIDTNESNQALNTKTANYYKELKISTWVIAIATIANIAVTIYNIFSK